MFAALTLACLAFSLVALGKFDITNRKSLNGGIALSLLGLLGVAYAYSNCGRSIRLLPEALEISAKFSDIDRILWSDIADIGIATFPSSAGGRLTYQYFVGIKFRTGASYLLQEGHQKNYAESGYHILLNPNYGLNLERFASFLKASWKKAQNR